MTKNKIKYTKIYQYIYIILLLLCILVLITLPKFASINFLQGVIIWATKVLPSLMPFFILSKLLSYTNFINKSAKIISPLTNKIYGVSGVSGYVYLMSIISGYPIGAKILSDLYNNNSITKKEAYCISSFTSTSGPLFIIGTVAIGLFNNYKLGILIVISHYIGAILNGLLYRQKNIKNNNFEIKNNSTNILTDSMTSSINSILLVGGYIALFYMLLNIIIKLNLLLPITYLFKIFGLNEEIITAIFCALVEVTTGTIFLSKLNLSITLLAPILTYLISFGGISIHFQALCFLKNFDMKYSIFLLQKTTHAIISTLICILIQLIL